MGALKENMNSEEKLDYIFSQLEKGMDREEIAENLGYKTYRSLDVFVKRQGYSWNKSTGTYALPQKNNRGDNAKVMSEVKGKAREVLIHFEKGEKDAKEIAKVVGFKDHKELAVYMRAKGFQWDDEIGNYRLEGLEEEILDGVNSNSQEGNSKGEIVEDLPKQEVLKSYGEECHKLLEFLLHNENILRNLITSAKEEPEAGQIPRYAIPGIPRTKSFYMKNHLAQLVTDFSNEKNVKQNDIAEAALIEYFKKYGYKEEVKRLLEK